MQNSFANHLSWVRTAPYRPSLRWRSSFCRRPCWSLRSGISSAPPQLEVKKFDRKFFRFLFCQLEPEILIEFLDVVLYLLIKGLGSVSVDFRQIHVQHDSLSTNRVDFVLDGFLGQNNWGILGIFHSSVLPVYAILAFASHPCVGRLAHAPARLLFPMCIVYHILGFKGMEIRSEK